jgi:hypothetical protein
VKEIARCVIKGKAFGVGYAVRQPSAPASIDHALLRVAYVGRAARERDTRPGQVLSAFAKIAFSLHEPKEATMHVLLTLTPFCL